MITVHGALTVTWGRGSARLSADGPRLTLRVLRGFTWIARLVMSRNVRRELKPFSRALARAGLTLRIFLGPALVLTLGRRQSVSPLFGGLLPGGSEEMESGVRSTTIQ